MNVESNTWAVAFNGREKCLQNLGAKELAQLLDTGVLNTIQTPQNAEPKVIVEDIDLLEDTKIS